MTSIYYSNLQWVADSTKFRGKVLTGRYAHWCDDFDNLPVDETCEEFENGCTCVRDHIDNGEQNDV